MGLKISSWDAAEELARTSVAILEMERNGAYVDVDQARWMAHDAIADESRELEWLREWEYVHGFIDRDMGADAVDAIWTSHDKLAALLYTGLGLGLPESPYWAKGRTKPGDYCTDHAAIDYLSGAHPEHREFLGHLKALRRARSCLKYARKFPTFINPTTGLVHPVFGPASDDDGRVGALSGRLACKLPELHQVPRDPRKDVYRLRRMFRRRNRALTGGVPETLVVADYSALEVVVLAQLQGWLFNDWSLAEKVKPGAPDIHGTTAHDMFSLLGDPVVLALDKSQFVAACGKDEDAKKRKEAGLPEAIWPVGVPLPPRPLDWPAARPWNLTAAMRYCSLVRDITKTIRYGLHYGKGAYGFGNTLFTAAGDPFGEARAGKMVDAFLGAERGLGLYYRWVEDFIRAERGIPSLCGRWCSLPEVDGDDWQFRRCWRRALNYPMQAGAADIVNRAMADVAFDPLLHRLGFVLILQVHDELILRGPVQNAPDAIERVSYLMTSAGKHLRPRPFDLTLQVSAHSGADWESAK